MSNTIVNTNVSALNSHRAILSVSNRQGTSAERLASGLRINRAADDAAGLSISEGMRNQIRALNQSTRNAQDGISIVQTSEGALEEIHRMAERVRVLGIQGANDTNSQVEREMLAKEVFQITGEILDIERRADFNGMQILKTWDRDTLENKSMDGMNLQIGANSGQSIQLSFGLERIQQFTPYNITGQGTGERVSMLFAMVSQLNHTGLALLGASGNNDILNTTFNYSGDDYRTTGSDGQALNHVHTPGNPNANQNNGLMGLNQGEWISHLTSNVDAVITGLSIARSNLGAIQNRLEHTTNSLQVASENLSAANSRIRDTDMASEMMNYTQANVLQQAGMSMLAQANQGPYNILQLVS